MSYTQIGLRAIAALALAGVAATLGWFNVTAWLAEGQPVLAALAGFSEAIALVFAVMVEIAVRERRFDRAAVCAVILLGFGAFNAASGHRAWEASQVERVDQERMTAQAALDRSRAELQAEIGAVNARIEAAAPAARGGPQTTEADRLTWEARTAEDRARRRALQARLDALPVVAEPVEPFPAWLVWSFLGFVELSKATGLWSIGLGTAAAARKIEPAADNVVAFDASEAARKLVSQRKDRQPKEATG